MKTINNLKFMDFYFNGKFLSEFGGFVGGKERLSNYPLLPTRTITTDRSIGQDGETVVESYLNPRPFEVPIFFNNIDDFGIRNIASWLDVKEPQWFYYKDDTLKIKAILDSNGTVLETLSGADGSTSLKFIAHDPYYYDLQDVIHKYDGLTGTTNTFNITNAGNRTSLPLFSVWGNGNITIKIYTANKASLYKTCVIKNVTSGFKLDGKYRTCVTQSDAPWYINFDGEFPIIPTGNYVVEILGNVTSVHITPRYRYV